MEEQVRQLVLSTKERIDASDDKSELNDLRVSVLGKSGQFAFLMRELKNIPPEQKPVFGKLVNDAKTEVENYLNNKLENIRQKELRQKLAAEKIDISIDRDDNAIGNLHPLSQVRRRVEDFFISMGFIETDGPEIETDYYNFEALNTPADHPARDMQDTFYITDNILLRTHTSPNQVRVMEKKQPPIKMICPGKVYRSDDDASHSPMFHQIEGLVVDKHITLCDLQGTLEAFAQALFDEKTKTRFRPSFFPFTEPSVEVDLTCSNCGGKGCKLCKGTGWIEVLGAGMVHPKVLENCGISSEKYTGYAFGMGLERIAMIKYGIPNIKLFFENDARFLKQFR